VRVPENLGIRHKQREKGDAVTGKRLKVARVLMNSGLAGLLARGQSASLLIVNYHRIRPSRNATTLFDDGVFGPDQEEFQRQMQWLHSSTTILDETGLLELSTRGGGRRGEVFSAVTFDDAYADCLTLAKPVLDQFGIRGLFFVPIDMIDSRQLGWWDLAAYLMKSTPKSEIAVGNDVLELRATLTASLRRVLNLFKLRPVEETGSLLEELSRACEVPLPDRDVQSSELMTWEQLRRMKADGHGIGCHTFSHRVLATLSPEEQEREIKASRSELAGRIASDVLSFAYPVGGPQHINSHSVTFVRAAGYQQAFTFNTGIAQLPIADRFQIPRESAHTFDVLRAKTLMPGLMGLREKRAV
jgi:peptidoglycan/xylan/chitin deacetylase (PgdA/CDA1 family)